MVKPKFKIIFCDFDGVICTARSQICRKESLELIPPRGNLDPIAIGMINTLCDVTGAKIVISSSWRSRKSLKDNLPAMGFLKEHLFDHEELWRTPFVGGVQRGIEIDQWLTEASKTFEIEKYVMLDDDRDFLDHQMQYLIWCASSSDGFSAANYWDAENILNGKEKSDRYCLHGQEHWGAKDQ